MNNNRRLAEIYVEQNPAEHPQISVDRNPGLDLETLWEDHSRIMQNWLDQLHTEPTVSLALTNWKGKVTRAYFTMIGRPLPKRKGEMVAIVTKFLTDAKLLP